ncbi:MAG TPA: hypothetical protein VIG52_07440 [Methyloceanibacter sp.]|jgi:hypothetical protein
MFPASSYDPETLDVLTRVFAEVWTDIQGLIDTQPLDPNGIRSALAKRIMAAAAAGERDHRRLKSIAMGASDA